MNAFLNSILERIDAGELLPAAFFASFDCDAALDARDADEFDHAWVKSLKKIEQAWPGDVDDDSRRLVDDIRRESFLRVSRATQQHEIASYVSDDFDLIVRCKLLRIEDDFVAKLWRAYERGEFPVPD